MTANPNNPLMSDRTDRLAYRLNSGLRDVRQDERSPFAKAHALLRGRYQVAIVLALVFASVLSIAGYFSIAPVYTSTAVIRVNPATPGILTGDRREQLGNYFTEFLNSQMEMIRSVRIVQLAMQSPEWRRLGRLSGGVDAEEEFMDQIRVQRAPGTADVHVSFMDEYPDAARAGADAVTNAYLRVYDETVGQKQQRTLQILTERRTALANQLTAIREEIVQTASQYGTVDLGQTYRNAVTRKGEYEDRLSEINIQLNAWGVQAKSARDASDMPTTVDYSEYTPEQLATIDDRIAKLLQQEQELQREVTRLSSRFGNRHRTVLEYQSQLDLISRELENRIEMVRTDPTLAAIGRGGGAAGGKAGPSATDIAMLQQQAEDLANLIERTSQEVMAVGQAKLTIERLQDDATRVETDLDETRRRIDEETVELSGDKLVELIAPAIQPVRPSNLKTRYQLAGAGVVGGVGLGFGLVLFFGLLDGRLRNFSDAHTLVGDLPMLGMLPTLPDDLADPEQARLAAYSVHHIRTMLQITGDAEGYQVYTVTSPVSGSGKTSLNLALALSFASSGARTLIIDADLDSGAVSSRLEAIARKRLGQILIGHGRITQEQLDAAVAYAGEQGVRVGEALVAQGVVDADEVDRALNVQIDTRVGLMDAIGGDLLETCAVETGIANLWILPVGNATSEDAGRISPEALRRVLKQARQQYDLILIDGGPMPGSVAAAMCAAASDGTVLIVSRGDRGVQLSNTEKLLNSLHARIAGVVFNRADARDIERSSALTSYNLSGGAFAEDGAYEPGELDPSSRRFGPMARAIVSRQASGERETAALPRGVRDSNEENHNTGNGDDRL